MAENGVTNPTKSDETFAESKGKGKAVAEEVHDDMVMDEDDDDDDDDEEDDEEVSSTSDTHCTRNQY